jgi:hypothetical protein
MLQVNVCYLEPAVFRVRDERIVEAWFFADNQAAADRFFGGTPAADFLA